MKFIFFIAHKMEVYYKMKIALFSSHRATRFKMVMEQNEEFRKAVKIFYSDDPKTLYLKDSLEQNDIQYHLCDWRKMQTPFREKHLLFSDNFLKLLLENEIDYVFCNGSTLLEGEILQTYNHKIVTFHAGLLPWYAGPKPIDRMLENDEFLMGTAAIFIDEKVDHGPIIMESIINGMAAKKDGYNAVTYAQIEMIQKVFKLLKEERIHVIDNHVFIDGANYNQYQLFPSVD